MLLFIYLAGSTSFKITVWQHCKAIILQINQSIKKMLKLYVQRLILLQISLQSAQLCENLKVPLPLNLHEN